MSLLWHPKADLTLAHPSKFDLKKRPPDEKEIRWMLDEIEQIKNKHSKGKLSPEERERAADELPTLVQFFCASIRARDGKKIDEAALNKEFQRLHRESERKTAVAQQHFGSSASDARIHTLIHYLAEELRKEAEGKQ